MEKEFAGRTGTAKRAKSGPRQQGIRGERFAANYLQRRGLRLLARNWHCSGGEIDLICLDGNCVVFVEVKQRRRGALVTAQQAISATKLKHLVAAAQNWVARYDPQGRLDLRIDLIAIDGEPMDENTCWITNLEQGLETDNG